MTPAFGLRRSLLLFTGLALAGCATAPGDSNPARAKVAREAAFPNIPYATWSQDEPAYRFYPGDEIELTVPSAPELNKTLTVQPDGRIAAPLVGPVMAADRTTEDLQVELSQAYSTQLLRPEIQIAAKAAPLKVFVGGEVGNPGVYDMTGDSDALRAVIQAGDFKSSADRGEVIVIRRGPGGRAMMRRANLLGGLRNPAADLVPLRRFDIVYVPRSGVSAAGIFVQQYLRDLVPVQFSYALGQQRY